MKNEISRSKYQDLQLAAMRRGRKLQSFELGVTGETRNGTEELAAFRYGDVTLYVWVDTDGQGNVLCVA